MNKVSNEIGQRPTSQEVEAYKPLLSRQGSKDKKEADGSVGFATSFESFKIRMPNNRESEEKDTDSIGLFERVPVTES